VVGNPTEIRDYRAPEDWPAGAKPLTKKIQYDDLYRATRIDYQTSSGTDAWTSPYAAELAGQSDPRRAQPAPHVAFDSRPVYQTFGYDWLGNTQTSDDDAHGFYDRSLGAITNDTSGTNPHPYQLTHASNKTGPATTRSGAVDVTYDAMGNVKRINLERNGACLPAGSPCSSRWDLQYDEVGRLSRIFRLDLPTASLPPMGTDTAARTRDLQFLYDESDERIVKMMTDASDQITTTLYPYETLEVRGTVLDSGESTLSSANEVPYLVAHGVRLARLHYEQPSIGEPRVGGKALHVLFGLGDHLGSTSVVLDKETSELVEASTYQGYGAKESDYRPARWKGFREDYGFTGKEDDSEFGIVYFGKRFYSPGLNRWLTGDPLAVHVPGKADLNLYAYVSGGVLRVVDPVGLAGNGEEGGGNTPVGSDQSQESVGRNADDNSDSSGAFLCGASLALGPVLGATGVVGKGLLIAGWASQTQSDTPREPTAGDENLAFVGGALLMMIGYARSRGPLPASPKTISPAPRPPAPPPPIESQLAEIEATADTLANRGGTAATSGVLPAQKANSALSAIDNPSSSVYSRLDRFHVRAGELADESKVVRSHPINRQQLEGGETVGHGGVRNLSNEELTRFGGPQGDDPITGFRDYSPGADLWEPGDRINIVAGHHRTYEIGVRVRAGTLDPNTIVEFQIGY